MDIYPVSLVYTLCQELNSLKELCITRYTYIYCYVLLTAVNDDPKAPFSVTTTPKCRGKCHTFPWITPLTLDLYLIMLSVKQGGIKYHFFIFNMTQPGIDLRSSGPLANSLTVMPMSLYACIFDENLFGRSNSHHHHVVPLA